MSIKSATSVQTRLCPPPALTGNPEHDRKFSRWFQ